MNMSQLCKQNLIGEGDSWALVFTVTTFLTHALIRNRGHIRGHPVFLVFFLDTTIQINLGVVKKNSKNLLYPDSDIVLQ